MKSRTASSALAKRYAAALFDLAREADTIDAVSADLHSFTALVDSSEDLQNILFDPAIRADRKLALLSDLLDKQHLNTLTRDFLLLLARNRRIQAYADIFAAFARLSARARGEIAVTLISARPLDKEAFERLHGLLADGLKGKVAIETRNDPTLIAGLAVQIGSTLIDASLNARLTALHHSLSSDTH